jgi:hypothetical protein
MWIPSALPVQTSQYPVELILRDGPTERPLPDHFRFNDVPRSTCAPCGVSLSTGKSLKTTEAAAPPPMGSLIQCSRRIKALERNACNLADGPAGCWTESRENVSKDLFNRMTISSVIPLWMPSEDSFERSGRQVDPKLSHSRKWLTDLKENGHAVYSKLFEKTKAYSALLILKSGSIKNTLLSRNRV